MKGSFFKVVTGVAAVYHILLAAVGFLCPVDTVAKVVQVVFGVALQVGPQLGLITRFASVYMLAFGIMLLLLSLNPVRYRAFALPALVLFGLRFANRVMFFSTLSAAGMSTLRNMTGAGLILFFFVAILLGLPKGNNESQTDGSAATLP